MNKFIGVILLVAFSQASLAKEVVESKVFGSWEVVLWADEWGDDTEIILYGPLKTHININPRFGFVFAHYNFKSLHNYWPNCDVTQLTYRIDGGKPVNTGMGGDGGGRCSMISLPQYMLNDMKKGKIMEIRAGNPNPARQAVSLDGFLGAWDYAVSLSDVPPKNETWMSPR